MANNLGLKLVSMPVPTWNQGVKQTYSMQPQYLTIHNTANDASALAEISYMIGNSDWTSYHWAVDDTQAIQAIPHNRNAWHCGDGQGAGNMSSIGIEICHSLTDGNPRYKQSEENGAKLAALVLHEQGWGIDRMRKHQNWSGKYCPHRILDNGDWDNFKRKVQSYLNQINQPQPQKTEKEEKKLMNELIQTVTEKETGKVYVINFGTQTYHHLTPAEYKKLKATHKYLTGSEVKNWKQTKAEFALLVSTYSLAAK